MADTQTTLGIARAALYSLISPDDPNDPSVAATINLAASRLLNSGKYKGCLSNVVFPTGNDRLRDYVTLPSHLISIEGADIWDCPVAVWSQFHQFVETGPGRIEDLENADGTPSDASRNWCDLMTDAQDGWATFLNIPNGVSGYIRLEPQNAGDVGKAFHIDGLGDDGRDIYGTTGKRGIDGTLAYPHVDTTIKFREVTSFQKVRTIGYIKASVLIDGVPFQISDYSPYDIVPVYHRYRVGRVSKPVRAICKRRHQDALEETDLIYPGDISALQLMIQQIRSEQALDYPLAAAGKQMSKDWLDDVSRATRGKAQIVTPFLPYGYRVPNVRWSR